DEDGSYSVIRDIEVVNATGEDVWYIGTKNNDNFYAEGVLVKDHSPWAIHGADEFLDMNSLFVYAIDSKGIEKYEGNLFGGFTLEGEDSIRSHYYDWENPQIVLRNELNEIDYVNYLALKVTYHDFASGSDFVRILRPLNDELSFMSLDESYFAFEEGDELRLEFENLNIDGAKVVAFDIIAEGYVEKLDGWQPLVKEHHSLYTNYVEVKVTSGPSKGIIPVGSGSPFYTNASSNPLTTSSLTESESESVTFWVNATGEVNSIWKFFAFANVTSDLSIGNTSSFWNITIDTPNTAPTISYIQPVSDQTPNENTTKAVSFKITVGDVNGVGDIDSIFANFSRNGASRNLDSECFLVGGQSTATSSHYTCTIDMWYFDEPGDWNINVGVNDTSGLNGYNTTETFQYNVLYSFITSPSEFSFSGQQGGNNVTSNDDPIILTNYGNANITNISLRGIDLYGESQSSYFIGVGNISVGGETGLLDPECAATNLVNGSIEQIAGVELLRGNYSIKNIGNENLYFCMHTVPSGIPSQDYSTQQGGSWTFYIAVGALGLARRRRRKKGKRSLLTEFEGKLDGGELNVETLGEIERQLNEQGSSISELLSLMKKVKTNVEVPVELFRGEIGPAEALCKYMKENLNMNYSEIALVLNRDDRTVWTNYKNASEKNEKRIRVSRDSIKIPLVVFANRKLSVLEVVIKYLRDSGVRNSEIAKMLGKDQRNTYALYLRAVKKLGFE
ncbi:MAG: hypothetical protein KC506_03785, partial [Nanoarchaeota archaeon]|nr:hypothetical protein [Nanoarchaeota archaeon]